MTYDSKNRLISKTLNGKLLYKLDISDTEITVSNYSGIILTIPVIK